MQPSRPQQTIARPVHVTGFGYWSGEDVRVEFVPARANHGIVFVRTDLPAAPRIPASVVHRHDTPRRTNLRVGSAHVEMVEHILAALAGLQIDNVEVRVDRPEMPGCDGSSLPFVAALQRAGLVRQASPRRRCVVRTPIRLGSSQSWIEARPCCSGKLILQYELDYGPGNIPGRQVREVVVDPPTFVDELAPCRTFCLKSEADALQSQGLGRRATYHDLLVFDETGPIDNQLRFPDECVRHKILDMLGDLALAGCDLAGRISAFRSGHHLNAELVQTLLALEESARESVRLCA